MCLGRHQHDVVGAPIDTRGTVDDGERKRGGAVRIHEAQAVVAQRGEMGAACDSDDLVTVLEQSSGDHATDRAGPEDDEPHQSAVGVPAVLWTASMYAGFSPPP